MRAARVAAALLMLSTAYATQSQPAAAPTGQRSTPPQWEGLWIAEGAQPEINGFVKQTEVIPYKLVGFDAPWNADGAAKLAAMFAAMGGRKADGWGYPMMMSTGAPLQFVVTPTVTVIVNMYREVRFVYTDGRSHPAERDRWPTTWGDSIGRWEGDTLVIDTVSVKRPLEFFFFAPPLSENAHYVERLRLAAPGRIESEITIEDPAMLTRPWTLKVVYVHPEGMDRLILDDFSNDRSGFDDGVFNIADSPEAAAATSPPAPKSPPRE